MPKPPKKYSLLWILRHAPKFVRTDPGGTRGGKAATKALTASSIPVTPDTVAAFKLGQSQARDTIDKYLEPVWTALRKAVHG